MSEVGKKLAILIKKAMKSNSIVCEVVSVQKNTCTVKPVNGGAELKKVRLRATADDSTEGILIKPKKNSYVLVSVIENNAAMNYVSQFTEIEEYIITIGTVFKKHLKSDGTLTYNDGKNEGLVVIGKLIEKLNNLENNFNQHVGEFNGLIAAYGAHLHPDPASGVTGPPTVPGTPSTIAIIPTLQKELENTKIKH